jgi:hypothetical protein
MTFPLHAFLSRHSFSVGGSLIRTADQARGKGGNVKLDCAYKGVVGLAKTERCVKQLMFVALLY